MLSDQIFKGILKRKNQPELYISQTLLILFKQQWCHMKYEAAMTFPLGNGKHLCLGRHYGHTLPKVHGRCAMQGPLPLHIVVQSQGC